MATIIVERPLNPISSYSVVVFLYALLLDLAPAVTAAFSSSSMAAAAPLMAVSTSALLARVRPARPMTRQRVKALIVLDVYETSWVKLNVHLIGQEDIYNPGVRMFRYVALFFAWGAYRTE